MSRFVILFVVIYASVAFASSSISDQPSTSNPPADKFYTVCNVLRKHRNLEKDLLHHLQEGTEFIFHVLSIASYLRMFLSTSTGVSLLANPVNHQESKLKEQQKIALASLAKTPIMERVNEALNSSKPSSFLINYLAEKENSRKNSAEPKNNASTLAFNLIKEVFDEMDRTVLTNSSLNKGSTQANERQPSGPTVEYFKRVLDVDAFVSTSAGFQAFMLRHLVFLYGSRSCFELESWKGRNDKEFPFWIMSRTIIRLANTTYANQVQEIFDNAVKVTMERNTVSLQDLIGQTDVGLEFFSAIEEKFNQSPQLTSEVNNMKREILTEFERYISRILN